MSLRVYFSSSSKVTAPPEWVNEIAGAGFDGWEVVAEATTGSTTRTAWPASATSSRPRDSPSRSMRRIRT